MATRSRAHATSTPGAAAPERSTADLKRELRWSRWNALREAGAARFPGVVGRIPNFKGAEAAAERLTPERVWQRARVLKCNPDLPQRPIRARALREGKTVYMPSPKLAAPAPFVRLDPGAIPERERWKASSIAWAMEHGEPVALEDVEPLDLLVIGSVAAAPEGARLGRGGGYDDLEIALLREVGALSPHVPIATTIHPTQLLERGSIPMLRHDVHVDLIVTSELTLRCRRNGRRPPGIIWADLDVKKRDGIPALRARAPRSPADETRRRHKA